MFRARRFVVEFRYRIDTVGNGLSRFSSTDVHVHDHTTLEQAHRTRQFFFWTGRVQLADLVRFKIAGVNEEHESEKWVAGLPRRRRGLDPRMDRRDAGHRAKKIAVNRSLRHDPYGILAPKSLGVPAMIPAPLAHSELQPKR